MTYLKKVHNFLYSLWQISRKSKLQSNCGSIHHFAVDGKVINQSAEKGKEGVLR